MEPIEECDPTSYDIKIIVGERQFWAHWEILRENSLVFEEFYRRRKGAPERLLHGKRNADQVFLKCISAELFEKFLLYVYTNTKEKDGPRQLLLKDVKDTLKFSVMFGLRDLLSLVGTKCLQDLVDSMEDSGFYLMSELHQSLLRLIYDRTISYRTKDIAKFVAHEAYKGASLESLFETLKLVSVRRSCRLEMRLKLLDVLIVLYTTTRTNHPRKKKATRRNSMQSASVAGTAQQTGMLGSEPRSVKKITCAQMETTKDRKSAQKRDVLFSERMTKVKIREMTTLSRRTEGAKLNSVTVNESRKDSASESMQQLTQGRNKKVDRSHKSTKDRPRSTHISRNGSGLGGENAQKRTCQTLHKRCLNSREETMPRLKLKHVPQVEEHEGRGNEFVTRDEVDFPRDDKHHSAEKTGKNGRQAEGGVQKLSRGSQHVICMNENAGRDGAHITCANECDASNVAVTMDTDDGYCPTEELAARVGRQVIGREDHISWDEEYDICNEKHIVRGQECVGISREDVGFEDERLGEYQDIEVELANSVTESQQRTFIEQETRVIRKVRKLWKKEKAIPAILCQNKTTNSVEIHNPQDSSELKISKSGKSDQESLLEPLRLDKNLDSGKNRKLFLSGGIQKNDYFARRMVLEYDLVSGVYIAGSPMKTSRYNHGIAQLGRELYFVGGNSGFFEQLRSVESYSPESAQWSKHASMRETRDEFSLVVCDDSLYAIGGHNGIHDLRNVERYNCAGKGWCFVSPMKSYRAGPCAVVVDNRYIYVAGGFNGFLYLNTVEQYDTATDTWTELEPMNKTRAYSCLVLYERVIYVLGGFNGQNTMSTCEVYNANTRKWSALPDMNTPRMNATAVAHMGEVYIFGGECESVFLETVECYNIRNKTWRFVKRLPEPMAGLRACLYLDTTEPQDSES